MDQINVHHHHYHVPGLLQTSAIMASQSSLSSVLLMSSLLGDSFLFTKLFRLSVYFVRCLPLLLVPKIFPLNLCFSSPSALIKCQKKNKIEVVFFFFSVDAFLTILLMYHISVVCYHCKTLL